MNRKLLKLGFYVVTYILLLITLSLLVEYRFMTEAGTQKVSLDEHFATVFFLIICSGVFGFVTVLVIIKDWIIKGRIPFYIGLIAFTTSILMAIITMFIII